MSEIKITTSGELKLNDDVVGRIEWLRPFVESDVLLGNLEFVV